MAGIKSIPALIKDYTPEERLEIALIENVQREDLSPVDEARAYKKLAELANLNQEEIARRVGKNRSTVANSLRLLKLPEEMLQALESGRITPGHGRAILAVLNPSDQIVLFNRIIQQDLSVRQAESVATDLSAGKRGQKKTSGSPAKEVIARDVPPEIRDVEQKLIDLLGTKVRLVGTIKKGRIEISYFAQQDLERLIDLMDQRVADWRPDL
jgi:ParB family chromosome partitioning protein